MATFSDVVDATDNLSVDEQVTLMEILRRRIALQNRDALVCDLAEARAEHKSGKTRAVSASDIMDEVRGET